MSLSFYILLISNGLIILLNTFFNDCIDQNEVIISALLITLIGIPHGAIDHLLFLKKTNRSQLFFYSFYLVLIILYVVAWVFFPIISLSLFLLLSAYHFGQSQFETYDSLKKESKRIMAFLWGTSILSSFVLINFQQISTLITQLAEFNIFTALFRYEAFEIICYTSIFMLISFSAIHHRFFSFKKEAIYFLLIVLTFSLHSLFIGFSLFFVFTHSLEVLRSEHSFLNRLNKNYSFLKFIRALIPFTALSIIGISFFYLLSIFGVIDLSLPLLLLVSISSLTLPHAVVMEIFYRLK